MKRLIFMAFVAIASVTNVWGQKYPDGYLTSETYPSYDFVPSPPSLTSGEFAYDFYHYQMGRNLRELDGVSEQAIFDEAAKLYQVFDESVIGINLSYETTPEILLLCERAVSDASTSNTTVKKKFQRIRPFATFNDPSLKPETDEEEAKTFSYPSGHSTRGYVFALVLCNLIPEKTSDIMDRAQYYAYNRVICGHHWKSDTDASLLLSAALFANIVGTEDYQQQLKKAREEYQNLKNSSVGVRHTTTVEHTASSSQAYTTNGTPATENSRGVIIQNGQKNLRQ